jgi:LmbE family N-acetylglucosaminyl deacetylase
MDLLDLSRAGLIVAHPDDEVLWFASILDKVGRIVMCYGPSTRQEKIAQQRRRVVAEYPLNNVTFLDLPQPRRLYLPTDEADALDAEFDDRHKSVLADRLIDLLAGTTAVFTHNAWGEYGHADHILVNETVNTQVGGRAGVCFELSRRSFHFEIREVAQRDRCRSMVGRKISHLRAWRKHIDAGKGILTGVLCRRG